MRAPSRRSLAATCLLALGCADASSANSSAEVTVTIDAVDPTQDGDVGDEPSDCGVDPTFSSIQREYIQVACAFPVCHGGSRSGLRLDGDNAYANLVGVPSIKAPGMLRVDPFHPENSFLVRKIEGTLGVTEGQIMPPSVTGPFDEACRIKRVKDWIRDGAPAN